MEGVLTMNGQIEVIRKRDLKPGDVLLIHAPEDKMKDCLESATMIFKDFNVKIVGVPQDVSLEVLGAQETTAPELLSK